jgi:hypothetical protein
MLVGKAKHSSSLLTFVNYGRKKVYNIGPRSSSASQKMLSRPEGFRLSLVTQITKLLIRHKEGRKDTRQNDTQLNDTRQNLFLPLIHLH